MVNTIIEPIGLKKNFGFPAHAVNKNYKAALY